MSELDFGSKPGIPTTGPHEGTSAEVGEGAPMRSPIAGLPFW